MIAARTSKVFGPLLNTRVTSALSVASRVRTARSTVEISAAGKAISHSCKPAENAIGTCVRRKARSTARAQFCEEEKRRRPLRA